MLRTTIAIAAAMFATAAATAAIAQTPPPANASDTITIKVSRQALQVIGQGLAELPLKTAAPILNDLQNQLTAIDKPAQDAAKPAEPEKPAEPSPAKTPPDRK